MTLKEACRASIAKDSLLEFMKYNWLKPSTPLITGRHTAEIAGAIDKAIERYRQGISTYLHIVVPFRHGKALALDTPVATTKGWSTIKDLRVGDKVYGLDGKPCNVIAKSPVWKDREVYEVSVDNGKEVIIADAEHEWKTKLDRRSKWKIYDTKTIANPRRFSCPVEVSKPIEGNSNNLVIPPYTLGLWLGDGSNYRGSITTSNEDRDFIREQIESEGFKTRMQSCGKAFGVLGLGKALRINNLIQNKHIPKEYFRATIKDRMSLLQGLIDSDGEIGGLKTRKGKDRDKTGGQVTFTNTNKKLSYDVLELVRALGVKASITVSRAKLYDKDCGAMYKVSFYLKDCARLERKRNRTRNAEKYYLHSIRAEKLETKMDTMCIEVDSKDHLFLVGKLMIPTHNSDLSSRYLPPYFLGLFPDHEVIQASYGATLSEGFSKDVRKIMISEKYKNVFDVVLDYKSNNNAERHIKDRNGKYFAVGADGGATGKGANLLIVDDFFKNRSEADSETTRQKRWESFTQDFVSRCAPTHIVLVLNTRWHVNDISGNILNRNDTMHKDYDENFPVFENLHYKAIQDDGSYLFPERFDENWYKRQKASLGLYGFASLMQGEPTLRGGNMFKVSGVNIVDEYPDDLLWVRYWDLASTEKERISPDPDYTAGALVAYSETEGGLPQIWIGDMQTCQAEAIARNSMIRRTAEMDGSTVWQGIESVAGFKDSYTILKSILKGNSKVYKCSVHKDKITRASEIEPLFDVGNVFMVRGAYNEQLIKELREFPACVHDDQTDAVVGGYTLARNRYQSKNSLGSRLGKGLA